MAATDPISPLLGPDTERYKKARKVHENADAMLNAMAEFIKDFQELRIKHGIPECYLGIAAYFESGGHEFSHAETFMFGKISK